MAFNCPKCGAASWTRTSEPVTEETKRSYHQCQNILCGCTFTTLTSVERYLTKPAPQPLPVDFRLPPDAFPKSHYGENQLDMFSGSI
ncbi:ogr/Delta-like zinc finger family protein [Morganella morganii]|uniref:ogr/Delta-like zinc finger family protein n=1 Tax=Morganella morganii TaxID=582 RepID=UPI0031ADCF57